MKDLPLEHLSVITEQPKRMMQDDYAEMYSGFTSVRELLDNLEELHDQKRALGDNSLIIRNGEGDTTPFNVKHYAPKIIEDKQQEILAIVARMRFLLDEVAKLNGGF